MSNNPEDTDRDRTTMVIGGITAQEFLTGIHVFALNPDRITPDAEGGTFSSADTSVSVRFRFRLPGYFDTMRYRIARFISRRFGTN